MSVTVSVIQVLTWTLTAMPFLQMAYANKPLSFYSSWLYVYLICSTFISFVFCPIYFRLLFCVAVDVKRQEIMQALLRAMIRLTDLGNDHVPMFLIASVLVAFLYYYSHAMSYLLPYSYLLLLPLLLLSLLLQPLPVTTY